MFSDKLRELREQSGMKQEELAKKMYLSRPVVSKWERGLQYPNVEQLKQLSHIFHISMDELMDNTDFMTMPEVQPIMETKEETNLELIIFSALLVLYFIKLLFDLTVEYWPTLIDWLLEDIVFLPVLAYATYKSYKKEVSPRVIGYMYVYMMITIISKSVYLYIDGVNKIGFHWIDVWFFVIHNCFSPLIYTYVLLLFFYQKNIGKKGNLYNNTSYYFLSLFTLLHFVKDSYSHFSSYGLELFAWDEHYIYTVIVYLSDVLQALLMLYESHKLWKKRIQAKESVSK